MIIIPVRKTFFADYSVMNWKNYNSYSYSEYMDMMENHVAKKSTSGKVSDANINYTRINYSRMKRLNKQALIEPSLKEALLKAPKQTWYVLTESWCGDAAQNLPYVAAISDLSPQIELRLIFRDEYPELIEKYHTNGSHSIPKLISVDSEGNDLFTWGPRPDSIQEWYIPKLRAAEDKRPVQQELHTFYTHNKGEEVQKDFLERLK